MPDKNMCGLRHPTLIHSRMSISEPSTCHWDWEKMSMHLHLHLQWLMTKRLNGRTPQSRYGMNNNLDADSCPLTTPKVNLGKRVVCTVLLLLSASYTLQRAEDLVVRQSGPALTQLSLHIQVQQNSSAAG